MKRILVIDDDPIATKLTEYTLEQESYHVLTATNGLEGLKMAQQEEPDLIILNVMLPGMDGFEVCRRLRAAPETARSPILMLSGRAQQSDIATGFKMGADEYLTKPTEPSEIIRAVESLLVGKAPANSRIITFLGSKGRVGATTTVVNLAIALSQRGKQVIAVDLCPCSGGISEQLGVRPQHDLTHLLDKPIDTRDRRDLEPALAVYQTGVRILSMCQPYGEQDNVPPPDIDLLFGMLREATDYSLVDLPFQPTIVTREILTKCDFTTIVSDYAADALTGIRSAVTLLRFLGISQQQIGAVVIDREGTFPEWELSKIKPFVEPNISVNLLRVIPYDATASLGPVEGSSPVILSSPDCPMARAIKEMAQQMIAEKITDRILHQPG